MAMLRSATVRPVLSAAPRARLQVRYATQDYGSGKGDPLGENPQAQGKNSREDLEHPGPPPPKVAQKSQGQQQPQSQSQSQSPGQSSAKPSGGSSGGKKGSQGARPKILNDNPPTESEQNEDVRQHNEEMDSRAERAHKGVSNKDAYRDKE